MKHLKILILCYERKEITRVCFTGIARNILEFAGCGIHASVYVSTDEVNRDLCEEFGFEHHVTDPKPIGRRLNDAVDVCLEEGWDYLMQMGSDDLMTTAGVCFVSGMIHNSTPMFGFNTLYVVNRAKRKMKRHGGLMVFGAGRCIARDVVIEVTPMWEEERSRGLDGQSQTRIEQTAMVRPMTVIVSKPCVVDIKTSENLNKYEVFNGKEYDLDLSICPEMKML
jgi:hypothetical protein